MAKHFHTGPTTTPPKVNLQAIKSLFFFFGAMMSFSSAMAQSQIISYGNFIDSNYEGRTRAMSLATDLQSAVYVENGEVSVYGEAPVCLYTNHESMGQLAKFNIPSAAIEMVIVKISSADELKRPIDLTPLSNYPKLKYIFISASIEMTENAIRQLMTGANNFIIIYNTVKTS